MKLFYAFLSLAMIWSPFTFAQNESGPCPDPNLQLARSRVTQELKLAKSRLTIESEYDEQLKIIAEDTLLKKGIKKGMEIGAASGAGFAVLTVGTKYMAEALVVLTATGAAAGAAGGALGGGINILVQKKSGRFEVSPIDETELGIKYSKVKTSLDLLGEINDYYSKTLKDQQQIIDERFETNPTVLSVRNSGNKMNTLKNMLTFGARDYKYVAALRKRSAETLSLNKANIATSEKYLDFLEAACRALSAPIPATSIDALREKASSPPSH